MKEGWKNKRLDEVSCFINGRAYKKDELLDNGKYPVLRVGNFFTNKQWYYSDFELHEDKYSNKGDLLYAWSASFGPRIWTGEKVIYHYHIWKVIPNRLLITKDFLFFLLDWDTEKIKKAQGTGTTMMHVSKGSMDARLVPIPPLPEQKRIVSILDKAFVAIDKAIANSEKNLQNTKEFFYNYLNKTLSNQIKASSIIKLGEVAEYFNGLTYSPKDKNNEGIIVLRSSNVQKDELDFSDIVRVNLTVKEKKIVKDGDILMCSRNGSKRLVGKTATIKALDEVMTFGTFMMIIRSQYNPYLSWFFKSIHFREQISSGENTMINQITRYMLDDVVLSFPPIEIQKEIVSKLDSLSSRTKRLESIYQQKLENLKELKQSILQKAFEGELCKL